MSWYIIGIVAGSILTFAFVVYIVFNFFKTKSTDNTIRAAGKSAEDKISVDLELWAKHSNSHYLSPSLYRYSEKQMFEVDGILLTSRALIVIEIKSIKGIISGKGYDDLWEKKLPNATFTFTNPIIQNDRHIKHITLMTQQKVPTVSLIIFANVAESVDIEKTPSHVVVALHKNLFDILDQINESLPTRLSEQNQSDLNKLIVQFRTTNNRDKLFFRKITNQKRRR